MRELLHLTERADWEAARAAETYTRSSRGKSLAEVGFIHASLPHQLRGTAEAFYADLDDLVVLHIDPDRVPVEIKVEDGFPHIYGPLPTGAVTAVTTVTRDAAGRLVLPGDPTG